MTTLEKSGLQIRSYYKPLQPTVSNWQAGVSYIEIVPAKTLQHLVYCYWELYSEDSLPEPFSYAVVADGCIDIFFNAQAFEDLSIMGYCKGHVSFQLDSQFHYVGIRFLPGMLPYVSNLKANQLSNQVQSLSIILPELNQRLATKTDLYEKNKFDFTQFDDALNLISDININIDERFSNALLSILKANGDISDIENLSFGISPRQLRRLFARYIGTSPKNFCKVVRFQHILNTHYSEKASDQSSFFDSGYYDQAHFIKDFRNFYGITPSQAISKIIQSA